MTRGIGSHCPVQSHYMRNVSHVRFSIRLYPMTYCVACLSVQCLERVKRSQIAPVKRDVINIATLHWSQLADVFVILCQTLRRQTGNEDPREI